MFNEKRLYCIVLYCIVLTIIGSVYNCIENFKYIASKLKQKTLPVAPDEGVYHYVIKNYLDRSEMVKESVKRLQWKAFEAGQLTAHHSEALEKIESLRESLQKKNSHSSKAVFQEIKNAVNVKNVQSAFEIFNHNCAELSQILGTLHTQCFEFELNSSFLLKL